MFRRNFQKEDQSDHSQVQQGEEISENQQSSEFITCKPAGRKNLCELCMNAISKYTCPKCQLKTCGISCLRTHKQSKNCSGIRDATQYKCRQDIDDTIVKKDYSFIEQMISGSDKVKKCLTGVNANANLQPKRFKILKTNVKKMYNVTVFSAPNILQRHRQNISFFFMKTKQFYWVFQLLYYLGSKNPTTKINNNNNNNNSNNNDSKNNMNLRYQRYLTLPTSDNKLMKQILPQDFLCKQLLQKEINTKLTDQFTFFLQNKQSQRETSFSSSQLFQPKNVVFKLHKKQQNINIELIKYESNKKVCECLHDIRVYEFPTIIVVHKKLQQEFLKQYKESKERTFNNNNKKQEDLLFSRSHSQRERERQRTRDKNSQKKKRSHQNYKQMKKDQKQNNQEKEKQGFQ